MARHPEQPAALASASSIDRLSIPRVDVQAPVQWPDLWWRAWDVMMIDDDFLISSDTPHHPYRLLIRTSQNYWSNRHVPPFRGSGQIM